MVFECDICEFSAIAYQSLMYHYVTLHDKKAWACKYCDFLSIKKNKVIRHSSARHLDEMTSPNDGLYDYFNEIVVVAAHPDQFGCYFTKQDDDTFKCVFCSEFVQQKDDFSSHLRSQHLPSQFMLEEIKKDSKNLEFNSEESFHCVCKLCHSSCADVELLADHILSTHPINIFSNKFNINFELKESIDNYKHKCLECPYTSLVLNNYIKHTQQHGTNFTLKCDHCNLTTDYEVILKRHNLYWHSERASLSRNSSMSLSKRDSDVEVIESESTPSIKCPICMDKIYKNIKTLQSHMRMKHSNIDHEDPMNDCEGSSRDSNAVEVINLTLPEDSVFRCEFCQLEFQMFDSLSSHCSNFHKKDVMSLQCHQCTFMTNQVSILTSHIATHNQSPPRPTSTVKPLQKHFECKVCAKKIEGWAAYMKHRKSHKNITGGFKCPSCPFVTSHMKYLKQHQVIHGTYYQNDKCQRSYRYLCKDCPYRSKDPNNLKKHVKWHYQANCRYTCPQCTYGCENMCFLTKHAKVHTKLYSSKFNQEPNVTGKAQEAVEGMNVDVGDQNGDEDIRKRVKIAIMKTRLIASKTKSFKSFIGIDDRGGLTGDDAQKAIPPLYICLQQGCLLHCEVCPFMADSVDTFTNHTSLHFKLRRFRCVYCTYTVPSMAHLLIHRTLHHRPNYNLLYSQSIKSLKLIPDMEVESIEGSIDTELYQKMFEFSDDFTLEPVKIFDCGKCPFSTPLRASLMKHIRGHITQFAHQCPYCTFSDPIRGEINSHLEIHFSIPVQPLKSRLRGDSSSIKEGFMSKVLEQFALKDDGCGLGDAESQMDVGNNFVSSTTNTTTTTNDNTTTNNNTNTTTTTTTNDNTTTNNNTNTTTTNSITSTTTTTTNNNNNNSSEDDKSKEEVNPFMMPRSEHQCVETEEELMEIEETNSQLGNGDLKMEEFKEE